ncbi:MAG: tyrosine protein kinase [Geobacteraceae bacterium GWC2_58_44]|nr:MAG: tyrosine protein kinase [Geobacteraceae bacterium GWC2_58_44]HBG04838.1 tyrosine protein kinase [Geobacter sp.]
MAIVKRNINKPKYQAERFESDSDSLPQDEQNLDLGASGEAVLDSLPSSPFRLFRGSLGRLTKTRGNGRNLPEDEGVELEYPIMSRPSDLQKMGYISPVYSLSRSVRLNPRVMAANRCVAFLQDAAEVEFYRQLRTRILQLSGNEGGATVMVTSALPGEGKTLTAINLALTFAKEFKQTALLVDCDLRQQQIHSTMGFASDRGLVDYLMDDCPIPELFVWPGVEKLTVISGGKTVKDSCELLGSPGMKDLVHDMKHRYPERYVFFDAPSILTSADAVAFAPLVDYILVVAQAGQTSLKEINRALQLLPAEKVLGLVMNRQ